MVPADTLADVTALSLRAVQEVSSALGTSPFHGELGFKVFDGFEWGTVYTLPPMEFAMKFNLIAKRCSLHPATSLEVSKSLVIRLEQSKPGFRSYQRAAWRPCPLRTTARSRPTPPRVAHTTHRP